MFRLMITLGLLVFSHSAFAGIYQCTFTTSKDGGNITKMIGYLNSTDENLSGWGVKSIAKLELNRRVGDFYPYGVATMDSGTVLVQLFQKELDPITKSVVSVPLTKQHRISASIVDKQGNKREISCKELDSLAVWKWLRSDQVIQCTFTTVVNQIALKQVAYLNRQDNVEYIDGNSVAGFDFSSGEGSAPYAMVWRPYDDGGIAVQISRDKVLNATYVDPKTKKKQKVELVASGPLTKFGYWNANAKSINGNSYRISCRERK